MSKILMYKGVCLTDNDVKYIEKYGLKPEHYWSTNERNVANELDLLFDNPDFSEKDIMSETYLGMTNLGYYECKGWCDKITCGTTDKKSALFDATRSVASENNPYLISFLVDRKNIFVDGRDFLYGVFYQEKNWSESFYEALKIAFGPDIEKYRSKVSGKDTKIVNAYVQLLCHEKSAIDAQLNNEDVLINGRYDANFLNSFKIRGLIPASQILHVDKVSHNDFYMAERRYKRSISIDEIY